MFSRSQNRVTLQINLTPSDLAHAAHVIPHQLRQWAGQVSETIFVVDTQKGHGPRFAQWDVNRPRLYEFLDQICQQHQGARWFEVDYSPATSEALGQSLFGSPAVPHKDWQGLAVYPYFFGIFAASHNFVLHLDSDMMFGGGSQSWVEEALDLMRARPEILACNPLPGPPRRDGLLTSQRLKTEPLSSLAFRADQISTRLFLMDRDRLYQASTPLSLTRTSRHRAVRAWLEGRSAYDTAETMISKAMRAAGLIRVDFMGDAPGMWSLHPPLRSQLFYMRLPELIERIESGDVPDRQRGDHDINESMMDWSGATQSRLARARLHLTLMYNNFRWERSGGG